MSEDSFGPELQPLLPHAQLFDRPGLAAVEFCLFALAGQLQALTHSRRTKRRHDPVGPTSLVKHPHLAEPHNHGLSGLRPKKTKAQTGPKYITTLPASGVGGR